MSEMQINVIEEGTGDDLFTMQGDNVPRCGDNLFHEGVGAMCVVGVNWATRTYSGDSIWIDSVTLFVVIEDPDTTEIPRG